VLYNALSMGNKTPKIAASPWDFIILPEKDQAMAIGNMHNNLVKIACVVREICSQTCT